MLRSKGCTAKYRIQVCVKIFVVLHVSYAPFLFHNIFICKQRIIGMVMKYYLSPLLQGETLSYCTSNMLVIIRYAINILNLMKIVSRSKVQH